MRRKEICFRHRGVITSVVVVEQRDLLVVAEESEECLAKHLKLGVRSYCYLVVINNNNNNKKVIVTNNYNNFCYLL